MVWNEDLAEMEGVTGGQRWNTSYASPVEEAESEKIEVQLCLQQHLGISTEWATTEFVQLLTKQSIHFLVFSNYQVCSIQSLG